MHNSSNHLELGYVQINNSNIAKIACTTSDPRWLPGCFVFNARLVTSDNFLVFGNGSSFPMTANSVYS